MGDVHGGPATPGRIAVVCGGGGIVGGVFEVGVLRALDQALGGGVVNSAQIYAGASAGALLSTLLAAGVTPQEMDHVVVRGARNRRNLPPLKRTSVYGLNLAPFVGAAAKFPLRMLAGFGRSLLPGESSRPADAVFEALRVLPPGVFSNHPLGDYVASAMRALRLEDSFRSFDSELFIPAINLDTGHRVVFGEQGAQDVPVSLAIRASAAVPLLFQPVRIAHQDFVDGGIERNLPVDVAVKHGASLVIAINPMVPIVNDPATEGSMSQGYSYLADRGMGAVADQMLRFMIRSQVVYGLQQLQDQYPEVDIVLFEPEANDQLVFDYHLMRYSSRQQIAGHAYESTKERILRDGDKLAAIFRRHGLSLDPERLGPRKSKEQTETLTRRIARRVENLPGIRNLVGNHDAELPF
ncbi:MAG: patatin-like phospholipase family protein [Deltaproteobacteria bacterium]|nr:patatin-like phospholipase family protein [Deltaproteobacteria bacterium]